MKLALALALSATACSSKSEQPPSPPPPKPPADAAPDARLDLTKPCLPPSLAEANVAYVRADGPRMTVCYGNGDNSKGAVTHCLVLDEEGEILGTRTFDDAEAARLGERELKQPRVDIEEDPDATVKKSYAATYDQTRACGFEDKQLVFFDLRTNKRIGTLALATLAPDDPLAFELPRTASARWVGNKRALLTECFDANHIDAPMSDSECRAWLVATSGESFAIAKDFQSTYKVLDDELIAVWRDKEIRWIGVDRMHEGGHATAPGRPSPVGDLQITRIGERLVVAHARPAGVFFVDRTTFAKTGERAIPTCP